MIKFMDLTWQHKKIKDELQESLKKIFQTCEYINGEDSRNFENEFSNYCSAKYCIGVANGTDALEIAIEALNLPQGSTILVPANSFIATAEAVTRNRLNVKFIPFQSESMLIDETTIKNYLDRSVTAIIAVHLYGNPVNIPKIRLLTDNLGIKIIEDCAQSHGAKFEGLPTGTMGHIGCFSFYPGKNLGAYGDAGAIVTNDGDMAKLVRRISNHGRLEKFDHEIIGRNSRLDNIQAAILRLKLKHLDQWTNRRRNNAHTYFKSLNSNKLVLPTISEKARHVFHHFVVRTNQRDSLKKYLLDEGIESGIHYPISIPKLNAYLDHEYSGPDYGTQLISLPVAEHLEEHDILKISKTINKFFG